MKRGGIEEGAEEELEVPLDDGRWREVEGRRDEAREAVGMPKDEMVWLGRLNGGIC